MALSEAQLYACYRRMEKPLYNVLYRWLWQAQDCQDIIHDAFVRVWDRRAQVDTQRLDNLVWTTALNLARNKLRWRTLWRFVDGDERASAPSDPAIEAERMQREGRLRDALQRLPSTQRHVLLLAEFGGLSTAAIAQVLDIPLGTVGSRKNSAMSRLRQQLQEDDDART